LSKYPPLVRGFSFLPRGWRTQGHEAGENKMEQPRTRGAESRDLSASGRSQHETLAKQAHLGDLGQDAVTDALMIPRAAHLQDAEAPTTRIGGEVTTGGSIPAGEKRLEAIQRACRMILVEAGLTTVQADRIRTHIQDILAVAAEQEREAVSVPYLVEFEQRVGAAPSTVIAPPRPKLTMILPRRNEVENVASLLARIGDALHVRSIEVVFVDDSDDRTAEEVGFTFEEIGRA
jgi:hypothetical protein